MSAVAAAGGLYATDALTAGEVYDLPFEQAYAELSSMPLPAEVIQVSAAGIGRDVQMRRDASAISWLFLARGEQAARFTATLSREAPGRTRVVVDYEPGPAVPHSLSRLTDTALMRKLAAAAMAEQVDSRLERRPFEQSGFMRRTADHLQNNPDELRAYGEAVGGMMTDLAGQVAANANASVPAAYEPPVGQPSPDATRPSLDLSEN